MGRNNRRSKSGPEVKAAIAGSKEVIAELTGNEALANKEGMAEKNSRGGRNPRGQRSGRGSRGPGNAVSTTYGNVRSEVAPLAQPMRFAGASGETYGTDTYAERIQIAIPQGIIVQAAAFNLSYVTGIQSGTLLDVNVSSVFGNMLKGLYGNIVRTIQSKGRVVRDTVLDEPAGLAPAGSVSTWLSNWSISYMALVGLLHFSKHADFNLLARNIANAIEQVQPRLRSDLIKLFSYPVPAGWIRVLDKFTGPKYWDDNGPLFAFIPMGAVATSQDLTLVATINAILLQAENNLKTLDTYLTNSPDLIRISNTFGIAYGKQPLPEPKGPANDACAVAMICGAAWPYLNTTAPLWVTVPNTHFTNVLGGNIGTDIPVWVPDGSSDVDLLLNLLRTSVYSVDPALGTGTGNIASSVGLVQAQTNGNTSGANYSYYDQTLGFTGTSLTSAVPFSVTPASSILNFFWAWEAALADTAYQRHNDLHGLVRVNIPTNRLLDETCILFERIFLGEINVARS